MIKKKTTKKQKEEVEKVLITRVMVVIGIMLFVGIFCQNLWSDQIVHKFKSPSFNGVGTSSHYLTIDCLLYTSPSPRDRQKSRMPSSA